MCCCQCVAVCCSVLPVCCSVLQYVEAEHRACINQLCHLNPNTYTLNPTPYTSKPYTPEPGAEAEPRKCVNQCVASTLTPIP